MINLNSEIMNILLKIFIAILCGTIIGIERQLTGHKGSIKVNVLICLGSCIFTLVEDLLGDSDLRMSANIITGVGFLCSGFIFKNGLSVNGLSTAATLWCSSALGILTSKGFTLYSIIISVVLFFLNLILSKIGENIKALKSFDDNKKDMAYIFNSVCLNSAIKEVKSYMVETVENWNDMDIEKISVNSITADKSRIEVIIKIDKYDIKTINKISDSITDINGVLSCSWQQREEG